MSFLKFANNLCLGGMIGLVLGIIGWVVFGMLAKNLRAKDPKSEQAKFLERMQMFELITMPIILAVAFHFISGESS